ncbi:capsular exopolysaccharide family [Clostridium sp. CAG:575]|nr:capsular exopolysaccharide family [Clostridium sp. CAG:575]
MNEELDLKEIVKFMYQRKKIIIAIIAIAAILGMLYTFIIKKPTYKVTAQILIDKADVSVEQVIASKEIIQDEIEATFDKTSKVIKVTTEMQNKDEALNTTNQYIEKLQSKLEEVYEINKFQIIETPELQQQASNENYIKDILIAVCVGIFIDGSYILIALNLKGLTNIFEIEEYLKIKALGVVNFDNNKKQKQDVYISENESIQYELKRIQANLMLNNDNKNPQTILFTGTKKGVGSSYITNNLAMQFAKIYSRILIIDTDIKNKTLTNVMNKKECEGVTNIISSNNIDNVNSLVQKTKVENLFILPVGIKKIGEEAFLTENMLNAIDKLKQNFDIILIDTSSINEGVLPICLTSITEATVLIAESGKVKQEDILKAKMEIENVGGKISGIVLNKNI